MKHLLCFVGISGVTFIFCLLASYVEENVILSNKVIPPAGVVLEQWLDNFRYWAFIGIISSGVASLFWYISGQCFFKINNWSSSDKRIVWGLFVLIPAVAIILGIIFTRQAQEWGWLAYLFYSLNGILCYYFATALFSPSSFKYTPLLASRFWRRIW